MLETEPGWRGAKRNQRQKLVAVRPWGPQICSTGRSWGADPRGEEALPNQTHADNPQRPAQRGHPCSRELRTQDAVPSSPRCGVSLASDGSSLTSLCRSGLSVLSRAPSARLWVLLVHLSHRQQHSVPGAPATQVSLDPPSVSPASCWLLLGRPSLHCPQGREGQALSLLA